MLRLRPPQLFSSRLYLQNQVPISALLFHQNCTFGFHSGSTSFSTMAAAARRLADKTILITGASSGIGRSTALEFARTAPSSNMRLILTARREANLAELKDEISREVGDGVKVLTKRLDVSDAADVRGFVGSLPEEWKEVDVLLNNA